VKNLCGECNACCKEYKIDKSELSWRDTDKAKGEICDKVINHRCAVYKKRPKPCKTYECLWIQLLKLSKTEWCPLKWRPDNLKINVNTFYNKENTFIFRIEELEKGKIDFNDSEIDSFLKMIFEIEKQQKENTKVLIWFFGQDKGHEIKKNKEST